MRIPSCCLLLSEHDSLLGLLLQTDVPLQCKDTMPHAAAPQLAAPALGSIATPLLFSSARGGMRLRVGSGPWSPSINLEKIGACADWCLSS